MNAIPSRPSPVPVHHMTHDHIEAASVPGGARVADETVALATYVLSLGGAR